MNSSKFTASTRGGSKRRRKQSPGSVSYSGSRGRGGRGSGFGYSMHEDSAQMVVPKLRNNSNERGEEIESSTLNLRVPNGPQKHNMNETDPNLLADNRLQQNKAKRTRPSTGRENRNMNVGPKGRMTK